MDPPAPFAPGATRRVRHTVRVGVGVVVLAADETSSIYVGVRKGSHGAGSLALPGGHLELYESWEDCARREVLEEMGIELAEETHFCHVTNDIMKDEEKHYVTLFLMARQADPTQVPVNKEPHKCEGWKKKTWQELKQLLRQEEVQHSTDGSKYSSAPPLFGPLKRLVQDEPPALLQFLASSS